MADLFQDFAFARLAASLDSSTTSFGVDSVDQLPTNAALAKGDFWMTLESTLVHPPSFEIVNLTHVDAATKTCTVVRGQAGTTATVHDPGTYIKGSLSAAMLKRLRSGRTGTSLPAADDAVFDPGERFTVLPDGQQFVYLGAAASEPWRPVSFLRQTTSVTTAVLAGHGQARIAISLAAGYRLYGLQVSQLARVRLYATVAQQVADSGRVFGIDPTGNHGVILDYQVSNTPLIRAFSPLVDGMNLESSPTKSIPLTVDNLDATAAVTVALTWMRTE